MRPILKAKGVGVLARDTLIKSIHTTHFASRSRVVPPDALDSYFMIPKEVTCPVTYICCSIPDEDGPLYSGDNMLAVFMTSSGVGRPYKNDNNRFSSKTLIFFKRIFFTDDLPISVGKQGKNTLAAVTELSYDDATFANYLRNYDTNIRGRIIARTLGGDGQVQEPVVVKIFNFLKKYLTQKKGLKNRV